LPGETAAQIANRVRSSGLSNLPPLLPTVEPAVETTRRLALWCGAIFLGVAAVSATRAVEPQTWLLENLVVVFVLPLMVWGVRMGRFSRLSIALIFVFLCLHEVGAHFTYSRVPYDEWSRTLTGHSINESFGWRRNHFDRLVHLLFGLCISIPIRELAVPQSRRRGWWSYLLPVKLTLSGSAVYELIEWGAAVVFGGDLGQSYVGTQGDPWDSQKDTALAALGAITSMTATAGCAFRRARKAR
jgi:putative membrane protein